MSKLRSLNTSFWSDPWIEELTPEFKLLFIYLITNEKTNMLGIYEASLRKVSFETGLSMETVRKGLEAFETVGKVKYIDSHIILVNYMKHQNYNTNMKKSAIDNYNLLPESLKIEGLSVSKDKPLKGFESLLNHYGMVRKVEVEYEVEVEIEKEGEEELKEESLYAISKLKETYLNNDQLVKAVIENFPLKDKATLEKRLTEFNSHLLTIDNSFKAWKDYTSHFKNWHKVSKNKPKQHSNRPTDNIQVI
jgi:hypothetical protein